MKRYFFFFLALLVSIVFITTACKKKPKSQPCDNKGRISITNKLDSIATIQIVQINQVFDLEKNFMQYLSLAGDNPYTFKITCGTYYKDTTFVLLVCDDIQMILE